MSRVMHLPVRGGAVSWRFQDGVLHLTGTVPSYRRKLAVERLARRLTDATAVHNNLEVLPSAPPTDHEIELALRRGLSEHDDITATALTLSVSNGMVTVRGAAPSPEKRRQIQEACADIRGVRRVRNRVLVDPDQTARNAVVAQHLTTAASAVVEEGEVNAAFDGRLADLAGRVEDHATRRRAYRAVRNKGTLWVRNQIQVSA